MFQVLLVYKGKGFCGGVIYKPTWILTASHCLENTDAQFLKVVAGTNLSDHSICLCRIMKHQQLLTHRLLHSFTSCHLMEDIEINLCLLPAHVNMLPDVVTLLFVCQANTTRR